MNAYRFITNLVNNNISTTNSILFILLAYNNEMCLQVSDGSVFKRICNYLMLRSQSNIVSRAFCTSGAASLKPYLCSVHNQI